jgi:hypothetical protein
VPYGAYHLLAINGTRRAVFDWRTPWMGRILKSTNGGRVTWVVVWAFQGLVGLEQRDTRPWNQQIKSVMRETPFLMPIRREEIKEIGLLLAHHSEDMNEHGSWSEMSLPGYSVQVRVLALYRGFVSRKPKQSTSKTRTRVTAELGCYALQLYVFVSVPACIYCSFVETRPYWSPGSREQGTWTTDHCRRSGCGCWPSPKWPLGPTLR